MKSIPEATAIVSSSEERTELESLANSTKTEFRLRRRARIVLLSAQGLATRAIVREVGCTTGTASKWRVRYAERRLCCRNETGERGNDPKYTGADDQRILAALDQAVPAGYARWTGPLIAAALGDVRVQYVWRFFRAQEIDLCAPENPTPVEALAHRLKTPQGKKFYALRKHTPEPVFGIIKSVLGFRQFMLRGLDNVRGVWSLVTMAWNMKRMLALSMAQ